MRATTLTTATILGFAVLAVWPVAQSAPKDVRVSARLGDPKDQCPDFGLEIDANDGIVTARLKEHTSDEIAKTARFDEALASGSSAGITMTFRRGSCAITVAIKKS